MVPNDALINVLRDQGYTFKRQTDRVMLYKRRGGTQRVQVRRNACHDKKYVRILLAQAGMGQADIDNFIASADS